MFELSFLSLGRFDAWPLSRFGTLLLCSFASLRLILHFFRDTFIARVCLPFARCMLGVARRCKAWRSTAISHYGAKPPLELRGPAARRSLAISRSDSQPK